MAEPERFVVFQTGTPTALKDTKGSVFNAAGASHSPGLVPDPGSSTHSPPFLLGDDGAFHSPTAIGFPTPVRAGDIIYWNGSAWVTLAGNNSGTKIIQETSVGVPSWVATSSFYTVPTVQRFTTGSAQTYTTPAGILYIKVRMCGGGGGGGAGNTNAGSNGNDTSFGTWTAIHGTGGGAGTAGGGGAGGTGGSGGTNGTGTLIARFSGGNGGGGGSNSAGAAAVNPFGGQGGEGAFDSNNGTNAAANTGAGGGGAKTTGDNGAGGGAAGEYVEFIMTAAQVGASQTYTVGTGGAGGVAGGNTGGNGSAGIIIVEEFYQ